MAAIGLVVGLVSSGYQMWQAHETKQEQKAALQKQEELQQKSLSKKKQYILASQKANLLASGISLESGLADVMETDTQLASNEEANLIADYYSTQIKSVSRTARSQYAQGIGNMASSAISYRTTYGTAQNSSVNKASGDWTSPSGQTFNYRGQ